VGSQAGEVGTHHLLLGLIDEQNGLGARALGQLGVTRAAVESAVAEIGVEGTSDSSPMVEVEIGDEMMIKVADPKLLERLMAVKRAPHAGRSWALMAVMSCSTTARPSLRPSVRSVISSCCHEGPQHFEEAVGLGVVDEVARLVEPFVGHDRGVEGADDLFGRP